MESSAKTGHNAQKIFIEAAKVLYDDHMRYAVPLSKQDENGMEKLGVVENQKLSNEIFVHKGCSC
jgi:hypothetical protein